jgi:hypothetical protein
VVQWSPEQHARLWGQLEPQEADLWAKRVQCSPLHHGFCHQP